MVRSKIGPFALESSLGSQRGNVFRGMHLQQKMQVAVRIFPIPLGMTPEVKREFAEEMEQLKLLRHLGVVRCYGGGFDNRDAYLAYELVEGESLEQILTRRERLPWETVLDYGLKICESLIYCHGQGWVHGRLRPSKILTTLGESVVKLSDFRRHNGGGSSLSGTTDLDAMVYCAPESFETDHKPAIAEDLYSLGVVLYRCLTGVVPFSGGNPHFMRQAIIETSPEPVATLVYDCPVWLSSIVQQLLDKNPSKRPFSAEATAMALRTAQQHAMQGISVAEHLTSGFSPLQLQADKDEAAKVLGIQPKKKKKQVRETSVTESTWALVLGIAAAVGGIYYMTRPMSEQTLYDKAALLMNDKDTSGYDYAEERYLLPLLERFPNGKYAKWAEEKLEVIAMIDAERRMDKNRRFNREPSTEGERKYEEASRYERFGDRQTAVERYRAIVELLKDEPQEKAFVSLSKRQIELLESKESSAEEVKRFLTQKLDEADQQFQDGDVVSPKKTWESILKLYNGNKEMQPLVQRAQQALDRMLKGPQ
jgi:eukaryotic-like serine/threonine-protein kinase